MKNESRFCRLIHNDKYCSWYYPDQHSAQIAKIFKYSYCMDSENYFTKIPEELLLSCWKDIIEIRSSNELSFIKRFKDQLISHEELVKFILKD